MVAFEKFKALVDTIQPLVVAETSTRGRNGEADLRAEISEVRDELHLKLVPRLCRMAVGSACLDTGPRSEMCHAARSGPSHPILGCRRLQAAEPLNDS